MRAAYEGGKRYIISMPPRHGKSEEVSHWTPTWYLENWPHKRVILTSYAARYARSWGRKVRNTLHEHRDTLRVQLSRDSKDAGEWHTAAGGGMVCAGVDGGITGRGADLLLVDDPTKNMKEANSLVVREGVWDWWTSTALTRLEPNASAVIVMTRWNDDDLAGRLIKQMKEGGDRWEILNFPAVALHDEPEIGRRAGDPLWAARYGLESLERIKRGVTNQVWQALFQQQPLPADGIGGVYVEFSGANVRDVAYTPLLPVHWAIDFNVGVGCSTVAQEHDPAPMYAGRDRRSIHVIDELIMPNATTRKVCEEFLERANRWRGGRRIDVCVYGDASGNQRHSSAVETDWAIIGDFFRQHSDKFSAKLYPNKSNPSIKDRVNSVNARLCSATGERTLFVAPRCMELRKDFEKVAWERDPRGNVLATLDKSAPDRTHVSDALGYYVHQVFGLQVRVGAKKDWF